MSGHSKWATTKRAKATTDSRRAKVFTKISNNISVAARAGADPSMNAKLRMAIDQAKAVRMPKENIERAVARGSGAAGGQQLEAITYEGFGPGGVGIIAETVTDNRNRTVAAIKHIFSQHGGNLGGAGSVSWQFDSRGVIYWPAEAPGDGAAAPALSEAQEIALIDAGAIDIVSAGGQTIVYCSPDQLDVVSKSAAAAGLSDTQSGIEWVARETIKPENPESVQQLLEALDDEDDVSNVYTNADL
jgi:YebC/PmpR family DNA-binding regulatory protein